MSGDAALGGREAAVLEAWLDGRTHAAVPVDLAELDSLREHGWLDSSARTASELALARLVRSRPLEWPDAGLTQGVLLDAFAAHCRDDLDDVDVVEQTSTTVVARWRDETSRLELRAGFLGLERLVSDEPTLLLGDLERGGPGLVGAFLDDAALRAHVGILDPVRLEKIAAVRSSVFVYLEWFLRDAYGVKVLPAGTFTAGLVDRGIISLG
ncbi:MAG: hypothetical protein ACRC50_00605, partial [Gaiella sp.]